MANELNIVLPVTGLTLVSKIWQGATQVGADIPMTENAGRAGHYYGDAPAVIANGSYMIIVETDAGVVKGSGEAQFVSNVMVNEATNVTKVKELHQLQGLDIAAPMTVTPVSRVAGPIDLAITGDGVTTTTVQRQ